MAEKPLLVYQHVARDEHYAEIAVGPAEAPRSRTTYTGLVCERVYFAGGRGLCLTPKQETLSQAVNARVFGADFRPGRRFASKASGAARASRRGAATEPRRPSSPATPTGMSASSTFTALIDMAKGEVLSDSRSSR